MLDLRCRENVGCKFVVQTGPAEADAHSLLRATRRHADWLRDRSERLIDVGDRLQCRGEGLEQFILQLGMEVVRQAAAQFGFDFKMRLTRGSAEEPIEYLFDRDRVAVARQDVRMHAARNDFAVDQHAVAVENDEIESLIFILARFLHANRYPLRSKTL